MDSLPNLEISFTVICKVDGSNYEPEEWDSLEEYIDDMKEEAEQGMSNSNFDFTISEIDAVEV